MPLYPDEPASLGFAPVSLPEGYAATPDPNKIVIDELSEPSGGIPGDVVRVRRPNPPPPSFSEISGAAFTRENDVYGTWKALSEHQTFGAYDANHNPMTTIKGTDLEGFASSFLGSANQAHTDAIAARIREELKTNKILDNGGMTAFAMQAVAGLLSPTTLLPGGAIYRGAKAGQAAAKSAATVGAANAGAVAIQEAVLHSQQYTRTGLESGLAVGGAVILGGVLGAGISGLSSKRFIAMSRALDDELRVKAHVDAAVAQRLEQGGVGAERLGDVAIGGGGSAGAASTRLPDIEIKSAGGLERIMAFATPDLRTLNASSPVAREIAAQLVESPLIMTRNAAGITTAPRGGSAETRIKTQGIAREGQAIEAVRDAWAEYRFGDADTKVPGLRHMLDRGSGKLSEKEFRIETGHAMSRGDAHDIPAVSAAARLVRKLLIDPLADDAIKYKLLDPEVVAKGRPKGSGGTGGGPDAPNGSPLTDPELRARADDILKQFEDVTGAKFEGSSRNAAVDLLLSDNDYMRQLRAILGLDDAAPTAALGVTASRQARAEFNDVVGRLDAGETVEFTPEHAANHFAKLGGDIDALPDGARAGVISSIRPVGGGLVEVAVVTRDGKRITFDKPLLQSQLEVARAFHEPASGVTVFSRLYGIDGVSIEALRGELRHENVHFVWRGLGGDVRARLAGHADKLQVLDQDARAYFDVIDAPLGSTPSSGKTLRTAYEELYSQSFADYKPLIGRLADLEREMRDAKMVRELLTKGDPADDAVLAELEASMRSAVAEINELRPRLKRIRFVIDAKLAEEAAAHMVEMHYHGLLSDADVAPVRADMDRLFGAETTAAGQRSEAMFAISDAAMGQSMRRDLDQLGYYSKGLEVAKSLKQAKGTPEQMLAQLKAAGVKQAEIEAAGLDQVLQDPSVRGHSITRDEIIKHLEESRVRLNEVNYRAKRTNEQLDNLAERLRAAFVEHYPTMPSRHLDNMIDGWRWVGVERDVSPEVQGIRDSVRGLAPPHIQRMIDELRGGQADTRWSVYALDPSNPTYRETVLHLPGFDPDALHAEAAAIARKGWPPNEADKMRQSEISRLLKEGVGSNFQSGHFAEPNIIGHMMTSLNKHEGKTVYTLDQIQSDWGQKLRDGGVRDEAKIADINRQIDEVLGDADRDWLKQTLDGDVDKAFRNARDQLGRDHPTTLSLKDVDYHDHRRLLAELDTAKASVSGHPLVNTTDQWTNTTLRRAIRQAAEADADYIAIPSGKTVLSYNSGGEHGMREFYDKIVPKNLRNLLQKIDANVPGPQTIAKLETPTNGLKGEGFTLFPLTSTVKQSVVEDGQPMFAIGGAHTGEDAKLQTMMDRYTAEKTKLEASGATPAEINQKLGAIWTKLSSDPTAVLSNRGSIEGLRGDIAISGDARDHMADVAGSSRVKSAVKWDQPAIDELRRLVDMRLPDKAIAEQLSEQFGQDISASAVMQQRNLKLGVRSYRTVAASFKPQITAMHAQGLDASQIADALSSVAGRRIEPEAVDNAIRSAATRAKASSAASSAWPEDAIAVLRDGMTSGKSYAQIAQDLEDATGNMYSRNAVAGRIMRERDASKARLAEGVSRQPDALSGQIMQSLDPYLKAARASEMAGLGVERDASGAISSVMRDGKRYAITRDETGNVAGIAEAPDTGTRTLAVTRDDTGALAGVDDGSGAAMAAAASTARETLSKTLAGAAKGMGLKGVTPERIDDLVSQLMQSAERAMLDGSSVEAAIARTVQDAIDPAGTLYSRIMAAIGSDGETPRVATGDAAVPSSDPVASIQAKRLAKDLQDASAERAARTDVGGAGGFSKTIGDQVWDDNNQSYIMRIYNRAKIIAQRPAFARIITDYFEGAQRRANHVLRDLESEALQSGKPPNASAAKDIEDLRQFTGLSRQDLASSAESVIRHILGQPEGRLMFDLPPAVRGPLKARTLRIPDALIEDYLERDINVISRAYTRHMAPDIEITRMFGSVGMEDAFAKVQDDYTKLMTNAKDEATRTRLQNEQTQVLTDLGAMADRMRGTYALPENPMAWSVRSVRMLKQWNFMSKLGQMTIAAFSDPFRVMMTHGVTEYFRDGVGPLFRGLKGLRMAGDELRLHGAAWDMVLSSRQHAISDIMDDYGRYSKFERGLGYVQEKFGFMTLMNQWNTALKTFSGTVVMNNIIRDAIRIAEGSATKRQITRMAAAGINEGDAQIIAHQFGKHGGIERGVYLPDTGKWDVSDPNVRNALDSFSGAIVRDVDRIIVTPGQDKPLMASTQLGSLVFQFKSFGFASMQRTLIAGLQQRDAGVVLGALMMVGMGGVSEWFKAKINRKQLPANTGQWVATAVDRSGLLAWLPDINHFMEQATGGQVGVAKLTGKELSRYASRNFADSVIGPTAGMIKDLSGATSGFARTIAGKDRLKESDIAALRRIIPLNNLFFLAYPFQLLEESVARGLGAVPSTRKLQPGR